ncbi:MAG: hypothetical protein V4441_04530 [Pseudomonadota bacterium]
MPKTHSLVLVNHPLGQERRDFEEIAAKVEALAPEISIHIVPHDVKVEDSDLPADVWARPAFNVAFQWPQKFRPRRGVTYAGRPINKSVQARKYDTAGVAVPPTVTYDFGRALNRDFWGDFVIMKPTRIDMTSHGNNVFLMRTERVAALAQRIYPPQHPARAAPVLIQKFINTGGVPESYRVLTLFGKPLYCMLFRQHQPRAPLYASDEELLRTPIASNAGDDYVHTMVDDPEVIAFAARAAAAMPAIPLQGIDVIRDMETGRLYVLESNPGGNTWHFSSKFSIGSRKILSREQRIAQFGAWDIAAKVLAERTLKEAR